MSLILVFTLTTLIRYIRYQNGKIFIMYLRFSHGWSYYLSRQFSIWCPWRCCGLHSCLCTTLAGRQARRHLLASDLPPGMLDVKGGRTVAETVPRYHDLTRNLTWRAAHPYTLARAIVLLGGNDLVTLTEEHLKDPPAQRDVVPWLPTQPCWRNGPEK